jgi:CheY-like chemotaxis protein
MAGSACRQNMWRRILPHREFPPFQPLISLRRPFVPPDFEDHGRCRRRTEFPLPIWSIPEILLHDSVSGHTPVEEFAPYPGRGRQVENRLPDGQQGLQALAGGHYDCVITELSMPVVDGLEMVRRMRFSADTTPVVICSAEISDADRATGQGLGISAFLAKPVSPEQLVEQLKTVAHTATALA